MAPAMEKCVDEIVAALYDHWTSVPELKKFLDDPDLVLRLRAAQRKYFMELFSGDYGVAYANDRIRVGETHNRVGLDIQWYTGGFSNYIGLITPIIYENLEDKPKEALAAIAALTKLIHLDQEITILAYINAREEVIAMQHDEILEISIPIVKVWEGIITAPILGTMDTHRTQLFTERLLEMIVETKSKVALIDITSALTIDTGTAQHLIDTINSVRLLGATVVITGVSPAAAQTLVHLGIDLSSVTTCSSLADGLAVGLKLLNLKISPAEK